MDLQEAQQLKILETYNGWAIAIEENRTNYDGQKLCAIFLENNDLSNQEPVVYAEIWPASYFSSEKIIGSRIGPITMEKGRRHLTQCLASLTNDVA